MVTPRSTATWPSSGCSWPVIMRNSVVHHLRPRAAARHLADVLAEIADGHAPIDGHLAFVGLLLAGYHAEQRRLAGPVGADEADPLPLLERRGSFDEENLVTNLLADVVESDHVRLSMGNRCGRSYAIWRARGRVRAMRFQRFLQAVPP